MCAPHLVDESARKLIAAQGAAFHQVTKSPFGADDEIGMLNLITPESMRSVMRRADAGRTFDLSVDYFIGMPSWTAGGQPDYQLWMTNTPDGTILEDPVGVGAEVNRRISYSGDAVSMYTHTGTHMDTLNHYGYHNRIWNGFDAAEHLGSRHWDVCGAEKVPPIVARGILLDFPAFFGVEILPPKLALGEREIADALRHQGQEVRPGDVVIIRTGQMTLWPDASYMSNQAGINREGAEYLARAGVIAIGADTMTLEPLLGVVEGNYTPVHTFLFAEAGVNIFENVNVEALAAEQIHEFAFIAAGLKLTGATASPVRPLAMPLVRR